jgi:KGK domain
MKVFDKSCNQELGSQFINELVTNGLNLDVHKLDKEGYYAAAKKIFKQGVDCQFLNLGAQSWKNGKVRININLEFYAEENNQENQILHFQNNSSESPLDDLRKMIN